MSFPAFFALSTSFLCLIPSFGQAADPFHGGSLNAPSLPQRAVSKDPFAERPSRFFVRAGLTGILNHTSATISLGGSVVPDASVSAVSRFTGVADFGYFLTRHLSVSILGGVPVQQPFSGAGSASSVGTLGSVRYGAVIPSANYHFATRSRFQPYVGGGAVYAIVFKNYDRAITNFRVPNQWGSALQGGVEYRMSHRVSLFADFKQVFITSHASGQIVGGVPVQSKTTLNPSLPSAGVAYAF